MPCIRDVSRILIIMMVICGPALAHAADHGQFDSYHLTPEAYAWFRGLAAGNTLCCSIADGYPTEEEIRDGHYWAAIDGVFYPVPDEVVIKDQGNPVGPPIIWYSYLQDLPTIRCFVPGVKG